MIDHGIQVRHDLEQQAYEHARKILSSARSMINADADWKRDQFYKESIRHMIELEEKLGAWRRRAAEAGL